MKNLHLNLQIPLKKKSFPTLFGKNDTVLLKALPGMELVKSRYKTLTGKLNMAW